MRNTLSVSAGVSARKCAPRTSLRRGPSKEMEECRRVRSFNKELTEAAAVAADASCAGRVIH